MRVVLRVAILLLAAAMPLRAETGYELWLRYRLVSDPALLAGYRGAFTHLVAGGDSPTMTAARGELARGLGGLLGRELTVAVSIERDGAIVIGTPASSPTIAALGLGRELRTLGAEGYIVRSTRIAGRRATVIAANTDVGALYGAFELLRQVQRHRPVGALALRAVPRIQRRVLNHWDNLDRSVERGYAGRSIWEWDDLPARVSPRYRDYARANASIGINGAVLTNVNANARVLTADYLAKVAAIAGELRPFGIRVYLTARFSAPIELGGLKTADPLDPVVRLWWKEKATEVFARIPDFGGFVVKANSEGQPGPQDYGRSHADGANMLADAVAPHGGVVMWRAFVYSNDVPTDRVRQAYDEFKPLDGTFRENAFVQVKTGALDFQPREPFHPLFGAMPRTPIVPELQITKEYLGQDTHLAYLGLYFQEVLRADTHARGKGSTVARVVDGTLHGYRHTAIAGVANIGDDSSWTGSQFNQANWYAYGRLAWDPMRGSSDIADEWVRMTFTNAPSTVASLRSMMMTSREAVVDYMTPLGLAHIMATGHHYGPAPWAQVSRADWRPSYYHRADTLGVGFDRTRRGSNAVAQYAPAVAARYGSLATVPDSMLLWFHHVPWTHRMRSGRTLWDELVVRYNAGVDTVRSMQRAWDAAASAVDAERHAEVKSMLAIQEREARWWRDATLQYLQTFSRMPIPARFEQPARPLAYYQQLRCPADVRRPRCDGIP